MLLFHKRETLYLLLAHSCSYRQVAVFCFDVVHFRNRVDVQDVGWTGQAHIEQGDQALSSRQHFCIFSILVEQRKRFVQHIRSTIVKSWWFHYGTPPYNIDRYCLYLRLCGAVRSEEHTSELQSQSNLVCRLLLEK